MPVEQTQQPSKPKIKRTPKAPRQVLPLLDLERRASSPEEVSLGFDLNQAQAEALRCLNCKDPKCNHACPIHTDIKGFIQHLVYEDYAGAYEVLQRTNPFPGICGRVCQHELFCEQECLLGVKLESVAIGSLERFVADFHRMRGEPDPLPEVKWNGLKVGMVGSGPAALICANDLARQGYKVTVFEALHNLGGVLAYGIPPFRLPRDIIHEEVSRLEKLGVEFKTDFIVGKTATLEELFEQGFASIFLGTGAGLPWMMGIPGENLIGVYTANEFLTRINLMNAYDSTADTPIHVGADTVVIGGGNSAMDAARWAKRLGSRSTILYRRGRAELKARLEEIEHAEEEGIIFKYLAAPVALHGDEQGFVKEIECIEMELGEPDESGRRRPVPIEGSNFRVPAETVVAAIGQGPNPTLQRETPQLVTKRDKIVIDTDARTSMEGVYAGGDVVRGGSTVILAMQDGRQAAQAIDRAMREKFPENFEEDFVAEVRAAKHREPRFRIMKRRELSPEIVLLEVHAPEIQSHWKPGQFVILRPMPHSERIPLTLVGDNPQRGAITLIVQAIGATTKQLAALQEGEHIAGLLGPLGKPGHIDAVGGTVLCIGGGVGIAELLPIAKAFKDVGNRVIAMCGARTKEHMILDKELRQVVDEVHWATDDGSHGFSGNVVEMMRDWREKNDEAVGAAHVIGPIPMMKFASLLMKEWNVPTEASLNPIMVDGTGMCGGCRVTVGGKVMFACVDGPEFDAHQVDFDELTRRTRAYLEQEKRAKQRHECLIGLDR